jgi:hypothetical protein
MSGFNMPPGVSPSDIPGNQKEDVEVLVEPSVAVRVTSPRKHCSELWTRSGVRGFWLVVREYHDGNIRTDTVDDHHVPEAVRRVIEDLEVPELSDEHVEMFNMEYDPTPWCTHCGARYDHQCKCGPIAEND